MKQHKKLDQRGVFHWHALVMLAVVIGVAFLGVNRINSTNAASGAANDALSGNFGACFQQLETQNKSKSLEATRKQALKYVTNRQDKAAALANSYAVSGNKVSLLNKLYDTDKNKALANSLNSLSAARKNSVSARLDSHRQQLNDRIGVINKGDNSSVQGRLVDYKRQLSNADTKLKLNGITCTMMVELRVFSFWPRYIDSFYKADMVAVQQAQIEDSIDKVNLVPADFSGSLNAAKADQAKLISDLSALKPSSIGDSSNFNAFFEPYNNRVKTLNSQDKILKAQAKKIARDSKKSANKKPADKKEAEPKVSLASPKLPPNFDRTNKDKTGYYKLPKSPNNEDYYIYGYGSNTGNGESTPPYQRYGKGGLIRVFYTVAVSFRAKYPEAKLVAGDLNAVAGHASHKNGIDIDIYVNDRKGADMRPAYRNANSVERSVTLGKMLMQTKKIDVIYYNDTEVINKVNAYVKARNLPGRMEASNPTHEFHMHVRLNESKGPYASCAVASAPKGCFSKAQAVEQPTTGSGTSSD